MPSHFAEQLRERLDDLANLRLRSDHYDEQNFGNALVEFEADGILVRFIRDRGIVTVEVGVQDRFLSLDFLASEPKLGWLNRSTIKQHYEKEDLGQDLTIGGDEGQLYEDLRQALADESEGQVECIKKLLKPADDEAARANQQAAPRGPYYRVCPQGDQRDAAAALREHWCKIVAAVNKEEWFLSAREQEAAFWESMGR